MRESCNGQKELMGWKEHVSGVWNKKKIGKMGRESCVWGRNENKEKKRNKKKGIKVRAAKERKEKEKEKEKKN